MDSCKEELGKAGQEKPGPRLRVLTYTTYLYPWKVHFAACLSKVSNVRLFFRSESGVFDQYHFGHSDELDKIVRLKHINLPFGQQIPSPDLVLDWLRSKHAVTIDLDSIDDIAQMILTAVDLVRKRVVVHLTAENRLIIDRSSPLRQLLSLAKKKVGYALLRRSQLVVAESEATADFLVHIGIPRDRISLLCHGVDPDIFQGLPRPPFPPLRVLYAGGYFDHKGIEYLVRAIESGKLDEIEFVIVDFGPDLRYRSRLSECPNVVFAPAGDQTTMASLYSSVHAVVVPSITTYRDSERSPNVLIESLVAGRAIIATNAGGIPSILRDAGIMIEQRSGESLISALLALASDRGMLESLMERSSQRGLQFDGRKFVSSFIDLIRPMLKGRATDQCVPLSDSAREHP